MNQAPEDITLSSATVLENQPFGTEAGTLSTIDPDAGSTFTHALVDGAGSTDNGSFSITSNSLQTAASFDYEAQVSYSVRVRTTDQDGLWYEGVLTITVLDKLEQSFSEIAFTSGFTNGFRMIWTCEPGYSYQLQYSDTLRMNDWNDMGPARAWSSRNSTVTHTDETGAGRRLYRIVITELP